mmetsp:Transcript_32300/g.77208  ORF Transcript_32300/g.77208 Transcript_32300/m.77208 type:complete len:720 (+) Transcript_32300:260-2419(+)
MKKNKHHRSRLTASAPGASENDVRNNTTYGYQSNKLPSSNGQNSKLHVKQDGLIDPQFHSGNGAPRRPQGVNSFDSQFYSDRDESSQPQHSKPGGSGNQQQQSSSVASASNAAGYQGQQQRYPRNAGINRRPNQEDSSMAIAQKNHRLAKELSDLRVRYREETKVVSRLTMENMNLASRCREAISQVASMKKEIVVYQKRQSEWNTLQKEVMALRKQIDKNVGGGNGGKDAIGGGAGITTSLGGEDKKQQTPSASSSAVPSPANANEPERKRSISPGTDLDRIMQQQFRKESAKGIGTSSTSPGNASSVTATVAKDENKDGLVKSIATAINRSSTSSTAKRENSGASTNSNIASSNTKIPISLRSNSSAQQADDEFDADIDMVDFFAKSQLAMEEESSSSSAAEPGGHLGSRTHSRKSATSKSMDETMPSDISSPIAPKKKGGGGGEDSLLSSLDAFEASFASAFPETSFSLTSDTQSSAKLDMSFEVPDFDPFFKTPNAKDHNNPSTNTPTSTSSRSKRSQMQDLFPESAMQFKSTPKVDVTFDPSPASFASIGELNMSNGVAGRRVVKSISDTKVAPATTGAADSSQQKQRTKALSPHSMSHEIEQLDAIANKATESSTANSSETASGGDGVGNTFSARARRRVKQPVSYAEPSTKSKLRRGDVLFPKVDAAAAKIGGRVSPSPRISISPSSELDRIMSEKFSKQLENNLPDVPPPE